VKLVWPETILIVNRLLVSATHEAYGLLSREMLDSACAQAEWAGAYGGDAYEIAAAYAFHLVLDHPFMNGNKRTAAAVADIFLTANGQRFQPPPEEYAQLIQDIVSHKIGKPELAGFFRRWCVGS
jgi:death on curing protein